MHLTPFRFPAVDLESFATPDGDKGSNQDDRCPARAAISMLGELLTAIIQTNERSALK